VAKTSAKVALGPPDNPSFFSGKVLGHFYRHLGRVSDAGLSGRPISDVGILAHQPFFVTMSALERLDVNFLLDLFSHRVWPTAEEALGQPLAAPLFVIPVLSLYFNPDMLRQIADCSADHHQETAERTGLLAKARATAGKTSRPTCSAARLAGSRFDTASVHSRIFRQQRVHRLRTQCTVRTRSRRHRRSSAAASAAAAAAASRSTQRRVGGARRRDLDVTDAGLRRSIRFRTSMPPPLPLRRRGNVHRIDEDRQHSVDHSSPLAMAYQRLNSVCEGSGLRRTRLGEPSSRTARSCAKGNSTIVQLRKPATLEHVDSGENMKRVLRHGQDRDRGHLGVGNGDEGLDYDTGWQEAAGPVTVRDLVKELREGWLSQAVVPWASAGAAARVINSPLASGCPGRQDSSRLRRRPDAGRAHSGAAAFYLSMLARTEPQLFASTCRVRVGTYRSGAAVASADAKSTAPSVEFRAGFYRQMWRLLERVDRAEHSRPHHWPASDPEMTAGEPKWMSIITSVPVPEYRQLVVEVSACWSACRIWIPMAALLRA
uniref:ANK_REP_REGION domain-containing protein n=1 Tax=Macrostomum lignano TaxID=282301 RepID=A0A1I8FGD8_9PLAT